MGLALTEHVLEDLDDCPCCGKVTRRAGGIVCREGEPWALYSLGWHPEDAASGFDLWLHYPAWEGEPIDGELLDLRFVWRPENKPNTIEVDESNGMTRAEIRDLAFGEVTQRITNMVWTEDPHVDELRAVVSQPCVDL